MDWKGHTLGYLIYAVIFTVINSDNLQEGIDLFHALLVAGILINPDIDKHIKWLGHRSGLTHSVLYAVFIYHGFNQYVNMFLAKEFGMILLMPILIHLILDLKGYKGYGLIRFGKITLSEKEGLIWVMINIVATILYLVYVLVLL